jgi:hypothetical protein
MKAMHILNPVTQKKNHVPGEIEENTKNMVPVMRPLIAPEITFV